MTRFFDPIANEYRECVTDIGRSLARRMAGEPAPETPAALTPSQIAQAMVPVPAPTPVVPLEDGWIAHKPGDPRPKIGLCHIRTDDGWCSEAYGVDGLGLWNGLFNINSGFDAVVAYKVIQP